MAEPEACQTPEISVRMTLPEHNYNTENELRFVRRRVVGRSDSRHIHKLSFLESIRRQPTVLRQILPKIDQRLIPAKTPYPSKPIQPVHVLAFAPAGYRHATFRSSLVVDCGSGLRGLHKSRLK
jgi:hypothetical protein